MKTKILLFVCLFIGVAVLFPACSEKDSLVPDLNQNDELTNSLKSKKIPTQFSGVCTPLPNDDPSIIPWYDSADDPRVTGLSLWVFTGVEQINKVTTELTGTTEIFVGATNVGDAYVGKWEMTWKGIQTLTSPDGSTFRIMAHCEGRGVEGEVLGLTATWKYTMVFDGTPESAIYVFKGKITEVEGK